MTLTPRRLWCTWPEFYDHENDVCCCWLLLDQIQELNRGRGTDRIEKFEKVRNLGQTQYMKVSLYV